MIHEIKKLTGRALNDLLTAELAAMRKFAYSLTGSMEGANEVVQITVERRLKSVVPHPGVRPGLFKVCKNLWIEEIRRRNSRGTDRLRGRYCRPDRYLADCRPLVSGIRH